MAAIARLKMISEKELEAEFFQLSTAAEEAHVVERAEAIKIQACWRGCLTRDRVNACRYAAVVIQRVFRGHLGRKRFGEYHREKAKVERAVYFNAAATGIQRYWRGFLTRKFTCDFYSRKAWIQQVLKVSEELKKEMEEMHQQQLEEVEAKAQLEYVTKFRTHFKSKHHQRSTKEQPGVHNSPYAFAFGGKPKTPGGTQDVDQHLKQTMRALVKTRPRQADVTLEALYYMPRSPTKSKKISVKVEKPTFFTSVHKEVLFDDYEVKTQKCAM